MSVEMTILLTGGVVVGVTLLAVLILAGPRLLRSYVISTGERARATILEKRLGPWATYEREDSGNVTAQQVILRLQVHPPHGAPYIAEDKFMAKVIDLKRLHEGCDVEVRIARNNPQRVVCLPATVGASSNPRSPMGQEDPKAKLVKLKEMLDTGLITPQEFEAKKREILARM